MAPIPETFPAQGGRASANYDFIDVANGLGFVRFLGYTTETNGGIAYSFTNDTSLNSRSIESSDTTTSVTWTFNSSVFNLPRTMKGTAIMDFQGQLDTNAGNTGTLFFTVTVSHVSSGGTVTSLGSAITHTISRGSAGTVFSRFVIPIALTQKIFKFGDKIRVAVVSTATYGATGIVSIAHDPSGKAGTIFTPVATYPTTFDAYMPFRIDL